MSSGHTFTQLHRGILSKKDKGFSFTTSNTNDEIDVVSPWYDEATLAKFEGTPIAVSAMYTPKKNEMVIHLLFQLVQPSSAERAEMSFSCTCSCDMCHSCCSD